jgi:hypothetical protein
MAETWAFEPIYTNTGNQGGTPVGTLAPSITAAATTSAVGVTFQNPNTNQIQIANQTSSWAYVNFGIANAVVAATVAASYPVAPGAVVVVTVGTEVNAASVILAAGAAGGSVTFTVGCGL